MDEKGAAVLYSGGKDSTYAIENLRNSGIKVSCLITMISENAYSYMLHTPNIHVAEDCAKALDIPIVFGFTKGDKEVELEDIQRTIIEARKDFGFTHLGSGGISSDYQKSRLDKIASNIGLLPEAPLWGVDQAAYLNAIVEKGYNFIITSVSAAPGWMKSGSADTIDKQAVSDLLSLSSKYRFNPALEGGEGETLVLDCPIYLRNRIEIVGSTKVWNGYEGRLEIKKTRLVSKGPDFAQD